MPLTPLPAHSRPDLLAKVTVDFLETLPNKEDFFVVEIDPAFSDTAPFCERYGVAEYEVANCVIVKASRGEAVRFWACVVLAKTKVDVNGLVRKYAEARRASFAPMEEARVWNMAALLLWGFQTAGLYL